MVSTPKVHLCLICLKSGPFCEAVQVTSLLQDMSETTLKTRPPPNSTVNPNTTNATAGVASYSLLKTCQVLVDAPDGSSVTARALTRLRQPPLCWSISLKVSPFLSLTRTQRHLESRVCRTTLQAIANFNISPVSDLAKRFSVTAAVVSRVTCDLPLQPVPFNLKWTHLNNLPLTDPDFGHPGRVYMLLVLMFLSKYYAKASSLVHQTLP